MYGKSICLYINSEDANHELDLYIWILNFKFGTADTETSGTEAPGTGTAGIGLTAATESTWLKN